MVCTKAVETKSTQHLRSYRLVDDLNITMPTICEAILATTSTDPVSIGDCRFKRCTSKNPIGEVETAATRFWCPDTRNLQAEVKCFVSIGAGSSGVADSNETNFAERWSEGYFRFEVQQGLQGIGPYDHDRKGAIEAATHSYMTHQERRFLTRDCVSRLL